MNAITISLWSLVLLIAVALAFDFMNGFHDGANSIATIVATGALTPKQAVFFAAAFNFVALWVFQLKVAATIGKGYGGPVLRGSVVIFGALMGALAWNIITWYYGIPSSSSHALIGGLVGATLAKVGGVTLSCGVAMASARLSPSGLHHHLAAGRLPDWRHADGRWSPGCSATRRRTRSDAGFACSVGSGSAPTASATAATMRRRPSVSSGSC